MGRLGWNDASTNTADATAPARVHGDGAKVVERLHEAQQQGHDEDRRTVEQVEHLGAELVALQRPPEHAEGERRSEVEPAWRLARDGERALASDRGGEDVPDEEGGAHREADLAHERQALLVEAPRVLGPRRPAHAAPLLVRVV
jgi:hypothetical protein